MLRMSWGIAPVAWAGQTVTDTEGAVRALDASIHRIQERASTPSDAAALGESARIMRERIRGEGCVAVERGERWSSTVGAITVTLIPPGRVRPPREP